MILRMPLSIIIPIGNYARDRENISRILDSINLPSCQAILVMDNQDYLNEVELSNKLNDYRNLDSLMLSVNYRNPGSTRNAGIKFAKYKWIAFWDSDDYPDIDSFLKMSEYADKNNFKVCWGKYIVKSNSNVNYVQGSLFNKYQKFIMALNPGVWRFIFDKDYVNNLAFPPLKLGEDQVFLAKVLGNTDSIGYFDQYIYSYVKDSAESLTNSHFSHSDLSQAVKEISLLRRTIRTNKLVIEIMFQRLQLTLIKKNLKLSSFQFWIKDFITSDRVLILNSLVLIIIFGTLY